MANKWENKMSIKQILEDVYLIHNKVNKNSMKDIPVHEPIGRSKRTIKQVLRYGQEFC